MSGFIVAVTGGVASGKSAVTQCFETLGVAVADADAVARSIVEPGAPALDEIVERFGASMLDDNGSLLRRALRERIFFDPAGKRDLEAIMHPRIRSQLRALCESAKGAYAVVAIPLLAEIGARDAYPWLNRVLVVDAPEHMQLQRLLDRDGITRSLAENMLSAQASRTARLAIADDVITNDGPLPMLGGTVFRLHHRFRGLAGRVD